MEPIEVGEVFTIADHTGDEQEVEVLGLLKIEGTDYVAVGFVSDLENDVEDDIDLFFMKIDEDGELAAIEDDGQFDKVSSAFAKILEGQAHIE